ncbi:hypothetical protein N8Z80_02390 [Litorivicinus sp.]|nr:hypothetical protein [Litorivicinus sp.]MDC1239868.1 hypothetical protein [Litorivicinus sp.]
MAKGNTSVIQKTALMIRHDISSNEPINSDTGISSTDYYAEEIADGLDGLEQSEFYDYYRGRIGTSFNHFADDFIESNYTNAKTAADAKRSLALFTALLWSM